MTSRARLRFVPAVCLGLLGVVAACALPPDALAITRGAVEPLVIDVLNRLGVTVNGVYTPGSADSDTLDSAFGSTRGALLVRGASGWTVLAPSTDGHVLTDGGAGADPAWEAPAGGGGGGETLAQTLALGSDGNGVAQTNLGSLTLAEASDLSIPAGDITMAGTFSIQGTITAPSGEALTIAAATGGDDTEGDYVLVRGGGGNTVVPSAASARLNGGSWSSVGGDATVKGGNGGAASRAGGLAELEGGSSSDSSAGGGTVRAYGASASKAGGAVTVQGGNAPASQEGGYAQLTGGTGNAGSGIGADLHVYGGDGNGAGGDVSITAGNGTTSEDGGSITVQGGTGNNGVHAGASLVVNGGFSSEAGSATLTAGQIVVTASSFEASSALHAPAYVLAVASTPHTAYANDCRGSVFTNEGASALIVSTLPTAVAGLHVYYYVQDADGWRVTANTGDTIRFSSGVSAAAGYWTSTTIGSTAHLVAINATEWVALSAEGSWTVGP